MDYTSPQQYADKVLRLTQRMLNTAQQNHWQGVAELEVERQLVINCLFQHPAISDCLAQLADTLHTVMELDRECILLGEQTKQQSSKKILSMRHNKKAVMAYRQQVL